MKKMGTLTLAILTMGALMFAVGGASASADSSPFAIVENSKGEVIAKWGAFYGESPGTQIQLAENYAECGNSTECSSPTAIPLYPKVILEAGVYHLLKAYGAVHPVWPKCEGIFAYSGVKLAGVSRSAEIGNDITSSQPCGTSVEPQRLNEVIYAGQNPANINATGNALKLSTFTVLAAPPSGPAALYGILANNLQGTAMHVSNIRVTSAAEADMEIGTELLPVIGTASSPVLVNDDTIDSSRNEGIVLEGRHMLVEENYVYETVAHGIAVFGPSSEYIEVRGNSIIYSSWGV